MKLPFHGVDVDAKYDFPRPFEGLKRSIAAHVQPLNGRIIRQE